jgi:hypothetical protein
MRQRGSNSQAMLLPKQRTDFNSNSLENSWTQADLRRQGIVLHQGMRAIFYDLDCEGDQKGFLHTISTVWWDTVAGIFRIDLHAVSYRFTPGTDLAVLDREYDKEEGVSK